MTIIQIVKHKLRDNSKVGHSQAEKAQSRERIVSAAARQIRAGGLDSVSIAELMKTAKLTRGGFYGHFPSRSALIAAALDRALTEGEAKSVPATSGKVAPTLKSILNRYLSPAHRDDAGGGCAVSALAGDVGRADAEVRAIMAPRSKNISTTWPRPSARILRRPTWRSPPGAPWSALWCYLGSSRTQNGPTRSYGKRAVPFYGLIGEAGNRANQTSVLIPSLLRFRLGARSSSTTSPARHWLRTDLGRLGSDHRLTPRTSKRSWRAYPTPRPSRC